MEKAEQIAALLARREALKIEVAALAKEEDRIGLATWPGNRHRLPSGQPRIYNEILALSYRIRMLEGVSTEA